MIKQTIELTPDEIFKIADGLIEQAIDENIPVRIARKKKFQVEIIKKKNAWGFK